MIDSKNVKTKDVVRFTENQAAWEKQDSSRWGRDVGNGEAQLGKVEEG